MAHTTEYIYTNELAGELGVCRCCLSRGVFQSMDMPYWWQGTQENYTEMLRNTFQITLVPLEKEGVVSSRLICDACVLRLRDADAFRRQVHNTELTLTSQFIQVKIEPAEGSHLEGKQIMKENFDNVKMEYQEDSKLEAKQVAVNFVSVKMEQKEHFFLEEKPMPENFDSDYTCPESDEDAPLSSMRSEQFSQEGSIIKKNGVSVPPSQLLATLHKKDKNEELIKKQATDKDPDWAETVPLKREKKSKLMRTYLARKKAGKDISPALLEEVRLKREKNAKRVREYRAKERALIDAALKAPNESSKAYPRCATEAGVNKTHMDTTDVSETTYGMSLERILRRRENEAKKKREIRARERAVIEATIKVTSNETYHKAFSRRVKKISDIEQHLNISVKDNISKSFEIVEKVRLRRENDAKRMRELRAREKAVIDATIKVAPNESYRKAFSRYVTKTSEDKTHENATSNESVSETSLLSLESIRLKRENQAKRMRLYRARERALINATINVSVNQAKTIQLMTPNETCEAFSGYMTKTSGNEKHMNKEDILEKVRLRRENDAKRMRELRAREKAVIETTVKNETYRKAFSRCANETSDEKTQVDTAAIEAASDTPSVLSLENIRLKRESQSKRMREYRARERAAINATVKVESNQHTTTTSESFSRHVTETSNNEQHMNISEMEAIEMLEKIQLRRESDARRMREYRAREKAVRDATIKMAPNETTAIQPMIATEPYETISGHGTETSNNKQHIDTISKEDISEYESTESSTRSREYRSRKKARINKKKNTIMKADNLAQNDTTTVQHFIKIETNEVLSRYTTDTDDKRQHTDNADLVC